jgi:hypothetical protein
LYFLQLKENENMKEMVVKFLENLFNCNIKFYTERSASLTRDKWYDLYRVWKELTIMGTAEDNCLPAELIAVKTVRARGEHVWEWLLGRPDIKVRENVDS